MDLYSDLEELRGMAHLLIDDVNLLRSKIAVGNPNPSDDEEAYRRFYVRAVFALVEAFVEQHRRLLIHLCDAGKIQMAAARLAELRQIRSVLDDGRAVLTERPAHIRIFDKIKGVYKAAADGFGGSLTVTFGDERWPEFKEAMEIRNQITHPKNIHDCWIDEPSLQRVIAAHEWFKALQNDFVRIAREHRERNSGLASSW